MTEFLAAAKDYKFDCLCMHFYGGQSNTVAEDQAMIESQVSAMASLASQYNIPDLIISEMARVNGDQEVCSFHPFLP